MRRASNRNVMEWTFMGNTRMHQVLREKGNKLSHIGIFTFEVSADGTISETGTAVSTILPYVKKWPHIKWLLTIMNHGTASIFTALRENTNGAQDTFISEIVRIIDKYPWCSGIDIDLERGGELANRTKANALFSRIYSTVKAKGANLHVNICLPGMTSVGGSVGGENWCVYADLDAYCDTAAIMSYGFRVCSDFSQKATAGEVYYGLKPRKFMDVNGEMVQPDRHLRLLQRFFAESRKVRLYGMKISVIIQKSRPTILQCLTVRGRFGRMKVLTVSVSIRSWKAAENWHWIIPDFLKFM